MGLEESQFLTWEDTLPFRIFYSITSRSCQRHDQNSFRGHSLARGLLGAPLDGDVLQRTFVTSIVESTGS